jgi:hypothetical protein
MTDLKFPQYFDKHGKPIDAVTWQKCIEDVDYRRVGLTELANGFWLSTLWLGFDMAHGRGMAQRFETMVFADGSEKCLEQTRYPTLYDAQQGHADIVREWMGKPKPGKTN